MARFAETLLPLLDENQEKALELAQNAIEGYSEQYRQNWLEGMRAKLGIFTAEEGDEPLIDDLLKIMHKNQADYTNTFRALTNKQLEEIAMFGTTEFKEWNERWQARLKQQQESPESVQQLMQNSNPVVIPRNHRVEEALSAAVNQGDLSVMVKLLNVLSKPYADAPEIADYCKLPDPSGRPYRTFCGT